MKKISKSIRIQVGTDNLKDKLNEILNVECNVDRKNQWEYLNIENDSDDYYDFSKVFFSILDKKWNLLSDLGVQKSDVSIWIIVEYNGQCNLEFSPREFELISKMGISVCISCWENEELGIVSNEVM